nr:response regulator transcription factor [Hydrococcus sp. Prado102]
ANNGIEAIALYTKYQNDIDVVLMDLIMPEMDGFTAIRRLKQINPQIDIIVASGLDSTINRKKATTMGVRAFLSKSYTIEELLDTLRKVLKRS